MLENEKEKDSNMLSEVKAGMDTIDSFIKISKEIAKLPKLFKADYQGCASDFADICRKILDGNENVVRWFNKFLYFDFTTLDAQKRFFDLKSEYEVLKTGSGYQDLKFNCGEIQYIYHNRISSKIWFKGEKLKETQDIFEKLTNADGSMVGFVFNEVFGKLSEFADEAEKFVDNKRFDEAEEARLKFKVKSRGIIQRLQQFSGELSALVLDFTEKARK